MRGSSSTWRMRARLDAARAIEALVPDGQSFALLEATDGSAPSTLLIGELTDDGDGGGGDGGVSGVPSVPLDPAVQDPFPEYAGWLDYEGVGCWLRVTRSLTIDPADSSVVARGDRGWLERVRAYVTGEVDDTATPPARERRTQYAPTATWRHDDAAYLDLIALCQQAILRGDAYQLCLTNQATIAPAPDPWQVYLRLRETSRTHHAGFLRLGDTTLVSASPERFLAVDADGVARSSPIKGTRPRSSDPVRDAALAAELVADEKERAENLMIVDLVRNDLSRVAALGTVQVTQLLEVESYPQVHQLVSTVEAQLGPGVFADDAVAALFPAGSMTGAPKWSAMQILGQLESGPRGLYAGAFGVIGSDGSADLAMTIRSIVFHGGVATVGAGGGITAMSRPEAEVAEMHLKAAPLLAALGVRG